MKELSKEANVFFKEASKLPVVEQLQLGLKLIENWRDDLHEWMKKYG